jgi:hypothetical protein
MNSTRIRTVLAVFFSPSNERWTHCRNRPITKEGFSELGGHFIEERKGLDDNIELLKNFEKTTSTHTESADFVLLTLN